MGRDSVKALTASEQATSGGVGPVELRDDHESELWDQQCRTLAR